MNRNNQMKQKNYMTIGDYRCMGGSNKQENLVVLTAKEHFLCHLLLTKVYPNNDSIVVAFSIMCNRTKGKCGKNYAIIRENYSRIQSERSKIFTNTPDSSSRPDQ